MKMRFFTLLILATLLQSCVSNSSTRESVKRANASALYDPPTVTLKDGASYEFKEGTLNGRGQKFHSDYSYKRATVEGF